MPRKLLLLRLLLLNPLPRSLLLHSLPLLNLYLSRLWNRPQLLRPPLCLPQ